MVQQALNEAFQEKDEVRVIINLSRPSDGLPEYERHQQTRRAQQTIRHRTGTGLRVIHEFKHVPAIAGVLSRDALQALSALEEVKYVQLDEMGGGALAEAVPSTGADKVRNVMGIRGKGVRVAVLDSGASTTHPAIADSLVGQHCFTAAACPPNDTDEGLSAEDDEDHGSNVTGIITSNGTNGLSFGYAPDTEIVAVKVLDRAGRGWVSDWVSGLEWVYDNLATYKVRVINMSLDTDSTYASASSCDSAQPTFVYAASQLNAAGVTIFASSGNTGNTEAMSAPACNTGFIAVGATYDAQLGKQPNTATSYQALFGSPWPNCSDANTSTNTVTCFTNTGGARLDLLAPGAILTSAGNGTTNTNYRGTSQASPAAAAVAALMLECNPALSPGRILEILKTTGQSVADTRTGRSYPLIRADAAVSEACGTSAGTGGSTASGGTSSTGGSKSGGGTTASAGSSNAGQSSIGSGGASSTTGYAGGQAGAALGGQANTGGAISATGKPTGGQTGTLVTAGGSPSAGTGAGDTSTGDASSVGGAQEPRNSQADRSDVTASCSCRMVGHPAKTHGAYVWWLAALWLVPRTRRTGRGTRAYR